MAPQGEVGYTESSNLRVHGFCLADRGCCSNYSHRAAHVGSHSHGPRSFRGCVREIRVRLTLRCRYYRCVASHHQSTPHIIKTLKGEYVRELPASASSGGRAAPHPDCGDSVLLADELTCLLPHFQAGLFFIWFLQFLKNQYSFMLNPRFSCSFRFKRPFHQLPEP